MPSSAPAHHLAHAEVLVIGAGVVGASIARELATRGVGVTVVDRAPGIGGGCSYANAALLAPGHVGPLASPALLREVPGQVLRAPRGVRVAPTPALTLWLGRLLTSATPHRAAQAQAVLRDLAHESTRLHLALADLGLNPTLVRTGAVDVHLRPPRRDTPGLLTAAELRELEPALAPEVLAGTHHDDEWVVESRSYVQAMLDDARDHGARVRHSTRVLRLVHRHGRLTGVETTTGTIGAGHVVLASGVDAGDLAGQVGLRVPLRGGRGYVIDVETPRERPPSLPVRLKDHRVVVTPLADRVRVCGAMEFGPEGRPADLRRADALLAVAARAVPGLRGQRVIDRWAGDRPCSPDGMPLIGTTTAVANLSIAAGHGMWGLVLAPVTARIIGDAVLDRDARGRHPRLDPDRFTRSGAIRRPTPAAPTGATAGVSATGSRARR